MTHIISNGSHWAGEEQSSIAELLEALQSEPLDPTFEKYGNFIINPEPIEGIGSPIRFWGNFFGLSHVFQIDTDEPSAIALLTEAIRANQSTPAYKQARKLRGLSKRKAS